MIWKIKLWKLKFEIWSLWFERLNFENWSLKFKIYDLKIKDYEKRDLEDGDTGDCIDTDGCTDSNGNGELHARAVSTLVNSE